MGYPLRMGDESTVDQSNLDHSFDGDLYIRFWRKWTLEMHYFTSGTLNVLSMFNEAGLGTSAINA
jgi:hypothetical protein